MSEKRSKKPHASPWWDAMVGIDSLTTNERLAHDIVTRRRDLTPSVVRIMESAFDEATRGRALTAFSDALTVADDPNRDPRVALANAVRSARRT